MGDARSDYFKTQRVSALRGLLRRIKSLKCMNGSITPAVSIARTVHVQIIYFLEETTVRYPFPIILIGTCLVATSPALFAANWCVNPGGTSGCLASITAAVNAAAAGDTIKVTSGRYQEDVIISKSLSIVGSGPASTLIDATGKSNGIFINGTASAPNPGVSDVTISGFTVANANFEGLLIASATGVTIANNHVTNNNLALSDNQCPGLPSFETNEAEDCGEGIHIMGTDHSFIVSNVVDMNSGGILISDETGPTNNNVISGNLVSQNGYACGITMASHPAASIANPTSGMSFGVFNNTVSSNTSEQNGLLNGGGAGAGVYAAGPGNQAYGNVISHNTLADNGLPGVAMHNHASVPNAPPITFRDNTVIGNYIHDNGADTGDAATAGPTAISIYSVIPITGIVVVNNIISNEQIGISFNSAATGTNAPAQMQTHFNSFNDQTTGISDIGAATVDGTLNWWGCVAGPGQNGCSSVTAGVSYAPWLTGSPKNQ